MSRLYIKTFEAFTVTPSIHRGRIVMKRTKQDDLYDDQFGDGPTLEEDETSDELEDSDEETEEVEDEDQNEEEESA